MNIFDKFFSKANIETYRKLPRIRQKKIGEDGLVCIAILLAHNNIKITLKQLRENYPQYIQGIGLRDIIALTSSFGIRTRALQCPAEDVEELQLPCMLYWKEQGFVVLTDIINEKFYICDPASPRSVIIYDREEFECYFCEVALEVSLPL